jgi:uncharacterized phage protein gp47/JayE
MYSRPNLNELVQRVRSDVLSRLQEGDALRRQDAQVYAQVLAGATHGLYGFIDWLSKQLIYDTAEQEYLERWCAIWGITRKGASAATGSVMLTLQDGVIVPAGTLLQAQNGMQYQTTAQSVVDELPYAYAPIQAIEPGAAGNEASWQNLNLVSPIAAVQASALAETLSEGADAESDDALRERLLLRIRQPPLGGAKSDYVAWALQVAGVTRAWVYPHELGLGSVTLRFVRDNDGMGADILPSESEVQELQEHLEKLRPVTAQLSVVAPIAAPLDFVFTSLQPNTSAVQAAIQAELQDLLRREAEPGGTILLSHIRAAISAAAGESDYALATPSADITNTIGRMSTMGEITWP